MFLPGQISVTQAVDFIVQLAIFCGILMLRSSELNMKAIQSMTVVWLMFSSLSSRTVVGLNPLRTVNGI